MPLAEFGLGLQSDNPMHKEYESDDPHLWPPLLHVASLRFVPTDPVKNLEKHQSFLAQGWDERSRYLKIDQDQYQIVLGEIAMLRCN
jgi:hypothetical protein